MATRYKRDKQKQQIEGQTLQWPQDTDEINRSFVAIVLSDLRFVASVYLVGILWPLYCLTFDLLLLFISSVSCGHCIVCPSICSFCLSRRYRMALVTMAKRYRRDEQKLQIEGQTIQWPQDTDEINRSYKSKGRQYNGHTIPTR
jgi:hypothetical protein